MRYFEICSVVTEGRHVKDEAGRRFLLDPSPNQFQQFFHGLDGAGFVVDRHGRLALGASPPNMASIDHQTIAETFGLDHEAARGSIDLEGNVCVLVWAAHSKDAIAPDDKATVETCIDQARSNAYLGRLARHWKVVVFNEDYQEIADYDLPVQQQAMKETSRRYGPEDYTRILAAQRDLEGLRAAMCDPVTGRIYTGRSHQEAIDKIPPEDESGAWGRLQHEWDTCTDNTGFVDRTGQFISRTEAERRWNVSTVEDIRDLLKRPRS